MLSNVLAHYKIIRVFNLNNTISVCFVIPRKSNQVYHIVIYLISYLLEFWSMYTS